MFHIALVSMCEKRPLMVRRVRLTNLYEVSIGSQRFLVLGFVKSPFANTTEFIVVSVYKTTSLLL